MFYGLNKFIKNLLPKRLFYRALLIVAAPIIILQIIISFVFFDSLWIKTNKGMTRALIGEIKFFIEAYDNEQYNKDSLAKLFSDTQNIKAIYVPHKMMPKDGLERWFSPMDRSLRRELKSTFGNNNYWFSTTNYTETVEVKIKVDNKIIQFFFPKEKIATSSVRLFILWITLPSILLILIALLFLKNQTRPIINLAKAAERFGKGDYINEFRPSGALEIRKAGYEFDKMAKRINRHLNQRSEMLSGISHDLRTPLTRLKLQLALLNQKDLSKKMSKDIDEMEKMLNDYLSFAKTQSQEETTNVDIGKILGNVEMELKNSNFTLQTKNDLVIIGRANSLKRCFLNIIQNGLVYGEKVHASAEKTANRLVIVFEDDGPGIPKDQYKNVFKPFYRLDKSRSLNTSGVGLGLSIVEDIINSHGGNIQLSKSNHKGLQVKVTLPF